MAGTNDVDKLLIPRTSFSPLTLFAEFARAKASNFEQGKKSVICIHKSINNSFFKQGAIVCPSVMP